MIVLRLNGGWLELPKKVTFSMKRTSPIFFGKNFNIISGSYSLPITIDASPVNRKLLKFPEFLNNQASSNDFECELHYDGNLINRGILNWKDASPGTYKIQFFSSAGALAQLKKKTFADYNYGGELTIDTATMAQDYPWFKAYNAGWKKYEDNEFVDNYATASLVVSDAFKRVFNQEGYKLETDFFEDDDYQELVFFKPYEFIDNVGTFQRDMKQAAPKQFVADALRGMANNFCLAINIDSHRRKVTMLPHNQLLENPLEAIDLTDRVTSSITRRKIRTSGKSLIKKFQFEHFDTLADKHKKEGKNILQFNLLDFVVAEADLPENAQEGDAIFIAKKGHYVSWKEDAWDTENGFQPLFPYTISDESGTIIKSSLIPPFMGNWNNSEPKPITESIQPTYYYGEDNSVPSGNGFICFYREAIARGRYDDIGYDGSSIGEKTLLWHGENGLYESNWRKWLEYLDEAYECECEMQLTDADLFNWNPLQPIKIFDEHSGGYHYFYWVERKIVLNNNGIQVARQKLLQVIF